MDPKRVLIVDRSTEAREILRTALERRGLRTLEAARAEQGLELARAHHPDLIVLDLETEPANAQESAGLAALASQQPAPIVMLGTVRRKTGSGSPSPGGEYIAKPYQYASLIHKIEQLLQRVEAVA